MPLGVAIVVLYGVSKTQLKISVTMVPTLSQRLHCFVIKVMNRNPVVNILLFMEKVTDVILFLEDEKRGSDWDLLLTTPHTCCNRWSKVIGLVPSVWMACQNH